MIGRSKIVKIDSLNRIAVTNLFEDGDWVVCRKDSEGNVYLEKIGSDDILFVGRVKFRDGRYSLHIGSKGVRALIEEFNLNDDNRYLALHKNGDRVFIRKIVFEG